MQWTCNHVETYSSFSHSFFSFIRRFPSWNPQGIDTTNDPLTYIYQLLTRSHSFIQKSVPSVYSRLFIHFWIFYFFPPPREPSVLKVSKTEYIPSAWGFPCGEWFKCTHPLLVCSLFSFGSFIFFLFVPGILTMPTLFFQAYSVFSNLHYASYLFVFIQFNLSVLFFLLAKVTLSVFDCFSVCFFFGIPHSTCQQPPNISIFY